MKKKAKSNKNFILLIVAAIFVVALVIAYLLRKHLSKVQAIQKLSDEERIEIELKIQELQSKRDKLQKQRLRLKVDLLFIESHRKWAINYIRRKFAQFRWLLFAAISSLFIIASFRENCLDLTVDELLKGISISVIVTALFFFASSEENQSLATTYTRIKDIAIDKSVHVIAWYYKRFLGINFSKAPLEIQEHVLYIKLAPIMEELRHLKKKN